jgi:hypothetical protein
MLAALLVLVALGHIALGVEVVNRLHGLGMPRKLVDALTAAIAAVFVAAPWYAWTLGETPLELFERAPPWLHWYAAACLFAIHAVVFSRVALWWDWRRHPAGRPTRVECIDLQQRLGRAATPGPIVAAAAQLPGNELLRLCVEHRDLVLERLPERFEGLRVAHLTDLHMSGRLGIDYFYEVVRITNEWRPDLVCLTGDIVERPECCAWVGPTLGRLEAKHGVCFILGNHDVKADAPRVRKALVSAGLIDVGSKPLVLRDGSARLAVAGDERPWFPSPDIDATSGFTLLLAHTPDRFGRSARLGVDLVLAGHNHGGQVCLPGLGAILIPSRHGARYVDGTFRQGRTLMHVGRGTGSLFPLRYNCPPELGFITLRRAGA